MISYFRQFWDRSAASISQPPATSPTLQAFEKTAGKKCVGNNIGNNRNVELDKCKSLCQAESTCYGFTTASGNQCWLQTAVCAGSLVDGSGNDFYTKQTTTVDQIGWCVSGGAIHRVWANRV